MDNLRITHVVPYFVPAWAYGGIPRLAFELAREEARMGHHVNVITTDVLDRKSRHPEAGCTVSMEGGRLKARYLRNVSNRRAYDQQVFMPIGMKKALDEMAADADVIHIHGHRHLLESRAARFARKNGIPYVITANGTAPRIERRKGIKLVVDAAAMDGILKNAAAAIAVSRAEIKQYVDRGVNPEKIRIIPNGLDVEAFRNIPERDVFRKEWDLDDAPIVLYLGKVTPRKGLIPLANAVNIVRQRRPVRLVIAGNDMGFMSAVKEEIDRLGMNYITIFTGLVRGAAKRAVYSGADVTVYPGEFEIFGLVPFESLLCGTPVVTSDDCGCGEIIGEAGIGEIVPYGDPELLAAAIERVLDDPEESKRRVERGRRYIMENLAWQGIATETLDMYRRVIRNK